MRILVAVTSFGTTNDVYLVQTVGQYRSMSFDIDIVVFSNLAKEVGLGVEVIAGLPTENPRSLPFAHKRVFAERLERYDLFIYTEDDILITETNIRAFLRASEVLPDEEVAGFLRFETDQNSKVYFADALGPYHWEPSSVKARDGQIFAFFTNEHAGAYILTREQLRRAVRSGGFLVAPHEGKHTMLETAATDPYLYCGLKKVICISHLDEFLIHHLSNKYIGKYSLEKSDFYRQIDALIKIKDNGRTRALFNTETRLPLIRHSKAFYEPARSDVLSLIPDRATTVLSIGCGWGAIEAALIKRGMQVVGLPLDSVIAGCAEARGVEIIADDFETAQTRLADKRFDVVLMLNILHLVPNPSKILATFVRQLDHTSIVIFSVPNLASLLARRKGILGRRQYKDLGGYEKTGVQFTSRTAIRRWLRDAGLKMMKRTLVLSERAQKVARATMGLLGPLLAEEIIVVARKV